MGDHYFKHLRLSNTRMFAGPVIPQRSVFFCHSRLTSLGSLLKKGECHLTMPSNQEGSGFVPESVSVFQHAVKDVKNARQTSASTPRIPTQSIDPGRRCGAWRVRGHLYSLRRRG